MVTLSSSFSDETLCCVLSKAICAVLQGLSLLQVILSLLLNRTQELSW